MRAELNKDDEIGGVYGTLELDEARAMGGMSPTAWYSLPRQDRAFKVATILGERRIDYYHSLKSEAEMKRRQRQH